MTSWTEAQGTILLEQLPRFIDHTLLKPNASVADVHKLCREAVQYGFFSVCVNGYWVHSCREELAHSSVKISAVVGFPLGAQASEVKAFEALRAVEQGANEIDMVLAIGLLLEGNYDAALKDIRGVVKAVNEAAIVKVILETGYLTDTQKLDACKISEQAGAHFVKTSTGFGPGGATTDDVRLMRAAVSPHVQVKASGGIRDLATALAMIGAGAVRLGTSSGVQLIRGPEGSSASPANY